MGAILETCGYASKKKYGIKATPKGSQYAVTSGKGY